MNIEQYVSYEDIFIAGRDFTRHELQALCIDNIIKHYIGDVYIASCYVDNPYTRAQAVASLIPTKLMSRCAFGWTTALWIYGLINKPDFVDVIAEPKLNLSKTTAHSFMRVHEMNLVPHDAWSISQVNVTTPERTAFDIALHAYGEIALRFLFLLKSITNFDEVEKRLEQAERYPRAKLGLKRIREVRDNYTTPPPHSTAKLFCDTHRKRLQSDAPN